MYSNQFKHDSNFILHQNYNNINKHKNDKTLK